MVVLAMTALFAVVIAAPDAGAQTRGNGAGPAYTGWTSFFQPQYGFQIPIPPGVRAKGDPFTAKRAVFATADETFSFRTWGGFVPGPTRPTLEQQWMEAQDLPGRRVDYRRWGGTWFEISGVTDRGRAFYEKLIRRGEFFAVYTVNYPPGLMEQFRPWMDEMAAGFTYNAAPPPTRITTAPEPDEYQEPGGFRRFWSGLTGEKPEPVAAPRQLEPWSGGSQPDEGRTGSPQYSGSESSGSDPRRSVGQGPVDLTPTPPVADKKSKTSPSESTSRRGPSAPLDARLEPDAPARPPAKTIPREDLPFGQPIPGKVGYVYSPFATDKGPVDVRDIPAGTKVRCPYTSKVFRVP